MKTVFDDVRRIWRLTTTERSGSTMTILNGLFLTAGALFLMAAGAAALTHRGNPLLALRVLAGGAGFWLALVWTSLFVPASMEMNTPANARLVPRQRRRLIQMAVAGWLLASIGVAIGYGAWGAFPAVGFALMGVPMLRAGRYGGLLLIMLSNWSALAERLLPASLVQAVGTPAGIALASALLLPVGAWVLRLGYPAGGDAHMDGRAWRWLGGGNTRSGTTAPVSSRFWTARFAYSAALRRDCRAPRPQAMLMHALGPTAHWSAWSAMLLLMLAIGLAVWASVGLRGHAALGGFIDWLLGFGMSTTAVMVLFTTAQFPQQLRKTCAEQALLRLTPLAGDPARLNRRLALGLLRSALTIWVLVTGTILLAGWLLGASGFDLLCQLAMCCLGGQVAMTWLLGDFASSVAAPDGVRLFLFVLQALVNVGLALLLARLGGGFWLVLALLGVLGAVLALVLGWRRMLAAAPAYPALRAG